MPKLEIESTDVLKLIHQYLKENQLVETLASLERETQLKLNTINNLESLKSSLLSGNWDLVLKTCSQLSLPKNLLMDLYEQIFLELLELREVDLARTFLRGTVPLQNLKERFPSRYLTLEKLSSKTYFEPELVYKPNSSKQRRREYLAKSLAEQVQVAQSGRLLTLLNQGLKYQHSQGLINLESNYDLFLNQSTPHPLEPDSLCTKLVGHIKLSKKEYGEVVLCSPNGSLIAIGTNYGFVQLFNPISWKLRLDLTYQAEGNFMVMEDSILSLSFSPNSEYLAVGDKLGSIRLFRISSGVVVRNFTNAHSQGILSLQVTNSDTIFSSSFDGLIRMFGIKSGAKLKEFRGHQSFVNKIEYCEELDQLFSISSDGTFKVIWDGKVGTCTFTLTSQDLDLGFMATNPTNLGSITFHSLIPLPNTNHYVLASNSNQLHIVDRNGKVLQTLSSKPKVQPKSSLGRVDIKNRDPQFVAIAASPKGEFVYGLLDDGNLVGFNLLTNRLETCFSVGDFDPIGITHHPNSNLLLVYLSDSKIPCYKP